MKAFRRSIAALAAVILCLSMGLCAMASDVEESSPAPAPAAPAKISVEGKSWDDAVDELLEQYNTSRYSVSAAYVNLFTGEEHFINPDNYITDSSLYLLPLNMYYADKRLMAENDWATTNPELDVAQSLNLTLAQGDMAQAEVLCNVLGGYDKFRQLTAQYMSDSTELADSAAAAAKQYSTRELAYCMKLLYTEADRFPAVLDTLRAAQSQQGFRLHSGETEVAQCYGAYSDDSQSFVHAYGIAYSAEPVLLVMMTNNVAQAEELLGAYCSLMIDYCDYIRTTPQATQQPQAEPSQPSIIKIVEEKEPEVQEAKFPYVACAAVGIFFLVAMVLAIGLGIRYRIRVFWLLLAIIISALTMGLAIAGMHIGTVYANPSGDPGSTADEFLSAICDGRYSEAYPLLRDYSDLGLETQPQTEAAKLAYAALHESFSYELLEQCSVEMLEASQLCRFTYLDLTRLEQAVVDETPNQLRHLVSSRPMNKIYDNNRNFLPEVTEEAYNNAVKKVLENAKSYYTTIEFQLALSYSDGRWQVLANPALLKGLNGGAGY